MSKLVEMLEQLGFDGAIEARENGVAFSTDTEKAVVDILGVWANGYVPVSAVVVGLSTEYREAEKLVIDYVDRLIELDEAQTAFEREVAALAEDGISLDDLLRYNDCGGSKRMRKYISADRDLISARSLLEYAERRMCKLAKNILLTKSPWIVERGSRNGR